MKSYIYIVLLYLIYFPQVGYSQIDTTQAETKLDTALLPIDSTTLNVPIPMHERFGQSQIPSSGNVTKEDSLPSLQPKISDDQPDLPFDYGSVDSSYLDLKENRIHLFGDAFVKYGKYNLDASYIIFDFDDNEASAFDGKEFGLIKKSPFFTDGQNTFSSSGLRYNFDTNKGLIFDAVTQEGEFQVLGARTKFVSADADSTSTADQIYNKNAVITTCTNPTPHYGIRARKLKVVPNRIAVAGFSQLELAGIPTPVVLPFGFYPLVDGLSSGIIFPADFDSNPNLGLGIRGVGYYFPLSDYMDLTVTGDFYTRGTHRITLRSNFKKRYKYSGNVTLRYANNIVENPNDLSRVSNKGFGISISRSQDSKAHPYRTISGKIDISTGDFYSTNFNDFENATRQQYSSSFNYRHTMPGTPFTFNMGLSHNQNTKTGIMNITLPDAKLTMTTIYPFKREVSTGGEKWYEKINLSGSSALKAFVSTADSTLFTQETLDNVETGMFNQVTTAATFRALKYINITPSASANQYLFLRTLEREFDETLLFDTISTEIDQDGIETFVVDTTYGTVNEDFINGFEMLNSFNTGISFATQIFGTKTWSRGWLRGLRHTMKPSVSFNYRPSTLGEERIVQITSDPSVQEDLRFDTYNPFRGGSFNPSLSGQALSARFDLVNNFEGKYYSKKDSIEKKFKFFREIRLSTSHNFQADSIKWQPLTIRGNTQLTKSIRVNFNAFYDFYVRDQNGNLTSESIWSRRKRPVAFDRFDMTLSTNFRMGDLFKLFGYEDNPAKRNSQSSQSRGSIGPPRENEGFGNIGTAQSRPSLTTDVGETLLEALESFSVEHRLVMKYEIQHDVNRDTFFIQTHQLSFRGSLQLTPKWSLSVQNIRYDFVRGDFIYPAFTLRRDLHCWDMNFSWYPASNVYGFFIGVRSSTLSFLKYNYGQQNTNNLGFGRPG